MIQKNLFQTIQYKEKYLTNTPNILLSSKKEKISTAQDIKIVILSTKNKYITKNCLGSQRICTKKKLLFQYKTK